MSKLIEFLVRRRNNPDTEDADNSVASSRKVEKAIIAEISSLSPKYQVENHHLSLSDLLELAFADEGNIEKIVSLLNSYGLQVNRDSLPGSSVSYNPKIHRPEAGQKLELGTSVYSIRPQISDSDGKIILVSTVSEEEPQLNKSNSLDITTDALDFLRRILSDIESRVKNE